jgi:iron complex transport system ATP-binding protein
MDIHLPKQTPALSAQSLNVSLGDKAVLTDVEVSFTKGRWTSLVGPNGAGKSTLLKALAGLLPVQGDITLLGQSLNRLPLKHKAQQLAWLGQESTASADGLTVYDTVMLGRLPHQNWLAMPSAADHAAVEQALKQTQAWEWRTHSAHALSGGERQRVLLARVLAVQAAVVLMDEPLANLDPPHQADWVKLVRALSQQGTTVVSVLHEMSVALAADEVVVMAAGRVVHSGACQAKTSIDAIETVFIHSIQIHRSGKDLQSHLRI